MHVLVLMHTLRWPIVCRGALPCKRAGLCTWTSSGHVEVASHKCGLACWGGWSL